MLLFYKYVLTLYQTKVIAFHHYSELPLIRPPMILVESGLNSEQVSLIRTIYIELEMCHMDTDSPTYPHLSHN